MTEDRKPAPSDKAESGTPNRGRRRLLQGGVGASPLLLTLVSRPVLGGNQCFTPSGFVSMPTSQHGQPQMCLGRTPGFWKQSQKFPEWPSPPYWPTTVTGPGGHKATTFNSVFGLPSPYSNTKTLLDILQTMGGPPDDVGRHIVAALLNAAKGWTPVLTVEQVKRIWREYISTGGGLVGFYEPTAGVRWEHEEIVQYLTSTMPV